MPNSFVLGSRPISIEDVEDVARHEARVDFAEPARARIRKGRVKLEERLAAGDRIYGVNTGVGGNIKFALDAEQTERF
ncbi:MAG: aromatic amino acid lyase, partial [Bryobacteraceae bacterium]